MSRSYGVLGQCLRRAFALSAGALLAMTGLSKVITVALGGTALLRGDPVLRLPYWTVFSGVGMIELLLAARLLRRRAAYCDYLMLGAFSLLLLLYRAAFVVAAPGKGCPCLGVVRAWLPVSNSAQSIVDSGLMLSAVVMLAGSVVLTVRHRGGRESPCGVEL